MKDIDTPLRLLCIKKCNSILTENIETSIDDIKKLSILFENGIFNYAITKRYDLLDTSCLDVFSDKMFKTYYVNRMKSLLSNLDPTSYIKNENLIRRFVEGEFTIEYLSEFMTHEEMMPEKYVREEEIIHEVKDEELTESSMKCRKCKQYKTTYYTRQLRSCDEPETCFITCLRKSCGYRYKI